MMRGSSKEKTGLRGPTRSQQRVLVAVEALRRELGHNPTFREVNGRLGTTSKAGLLRHVRALKARGLMAHEPYVPRSLSVTSDGLSVVLEGMRNG